MMFPECKACGQQCMPKCRFVHLLRRCDESGCYELVRARTTWRPEYGKQQLMH